LNVWPVFAVAVIDTWAAAFEIFHPAGYVFID